MSTTAPAAPCAAVDLDPLAVTIQTDDGELRELPGDYVAEHLELAYALTGHGSQGATVERAQVIGAPEAFTNEWAYTALSRARDPVTVHLIAETHRPFRARRVRARRPRTGPAGGDRGDARCDAPLRTRGPRARPSLDPTAPHTASPAEAAADCAERTQRQQLALDLDRSAVDRRAGARDASGRARPRAAVAGGANASSRPHRPRRDRTRAAGPRPRPARTAR